MNDLSSLSNKRIAFVGFGDIASKAYQVLLDQFDLGARPTSIVLRRNPQAILEISSESIEAQAIDVTQPESLAGLKTLNADYWVITLSPDKMSEQDYQQTYVDGLKNIVSIAKEMQEQTEESLPKRIFWISSTSVYGQSDDEWVDESSETKPQRYSGQKQLLAEQVLYDSELSIPYTIIRFSGIYRDRKHSLIEKLENHQLAAQVEHDYFTNRIHVKDAARVILHLMSLDAQGKAIDNLYLATDDLPVKYKALINTLSDILDLPLNPDLPSNTRRVNSKKCSNKKLKATGFELLYPSFKKGFFSNSNFNK